MLHIIFLILKIIGIVLGLIVLLFLLLLFVPIRYKGNLDYFESGNGWIKIYWLLHLISVKLMIEQNHPQLVIKVLGIPLGSRKKKTEEEPFEWERDLEVSPKQAEPDPLPEKAEPEPAAELAEETKRESSSEEEVEEIAEQLDEQAKERPAESISVWKRVVQAIQAFWNRIASIPAKLTAIWKRGKANVLAIWKKLTSSKQKLTEIKEILLEENSRKVYTLLKFRLFRIIRHIRPRKFQLYLHYGLEDPALTGEITGAAAMLIGWYGNAVSLEPDFQQTVLEGSLKFKGRIRIAVLLWEGICIVLQKSVRVMIKKLMGKIRE